ncbi:class V chitinase-like [Corylus avellana]|uniref:class V chitinase-like n=1 Tax=Corylus avellana TaxID=13451 RepID=UPI00286A1E7D|nr:class V chitinase-like [Corylus avellana]
MTKLGSLLTEWSAAVKHESDLTGNGRLDWINLVAYDFYDPALSRNATGPFATLYGGNDTIIPLYGDLGVEAWIQAPVAAQQIVLGLPFYGAAWLLVDATKTEIFAPANGPADGHAAGVYIDPINGTILYNQIKYFIETHPEGNEKYSADYVLDYFSAEKTWIGYNGIKSITAKVTYARDKTLLGYYAWHVGGDRDRTLSGAASGAWPIPGPERDTATGTSTSTGTATATATSTASGVGTVTGTVTSAITGTNTNKHTFICTNTCPAPAPARCENYQQ